MVLFRQTLLLILAFGLTACASMGDGSQSEKRQNILNMKEQVLTELFRNKPDTRSQINAAPGYAVFSKC